MALIAKVGVDTAGGVITGPGAPTWTLDGAPISLLGDGVAGHGSGAHAGPVMAQGSSWMTIDGIPVVATGCLASCGDQAVGSSVWDIPL